jgi:hypothetical protein
MFQDVTSSSSLKTFTCACCAGSEPVSERNIITYNAFDPNLLKHPDVRHHQDGIIDNENWVPDNPQYHRPMPYTDSPLADKLLHPRCIPE